MSDSSANAALEELIYADRLWVISVYMLIAANVVWLHDYCQTFVMELRAIWSRKLTGSSMLFIVNRYMFLLYIISQSAMDLPGTSEDAQCDKLYFVTWISQAIAFLTTSALLALRVYAIYGQNKTILILCGVSIAVRFALSIRRNTLQFGGSSQGGSQEFLSRCVIEIPDDPSWYLYFKLQAASVFLTLSFDLLIFVLTLRKTYSHGKEMKSLGQLSITQLILHDGVMYFSIVALIGMVQAAIQITSLTSNDNDYIDTTTPFYNMLPNLLASRLVLNLRMFDQPREAHSLPTISLATKQVDDMAFAQNRVLGNIGAPLNPGQWDSIYDEEMDDAYRDDEVDGSLGRQEGSLEERDKEESVTELVNGAYGDDGLRRIDV